MKEYNNEMQVVLNYFFFMLPSVPAQRKYIHGISTKKVTIVWFSITDFW